jgi:multisubunit Na+/H+ antiporter MnhE subunit
MAQIKFRFPLQIAVIDEFNYYIEVYFYWLWIRKLCIFGHFAIGCTVGIIIADFMSIFRIGTNNVVAPYAYDASKIKLNTMTRVMAHYHKKAIHTIANLFHLFLTRE